MDVREKLVELLTEFYGCDPMYYDVDALAIAQHLIANGVTVQKRGWIKVYQNAMYPYSCSECGNCHSRKVNFCERCGTKLDLPQPPKGE